MFTCKNCGKILWVNYRKMSDGKNYCENCYQGFFRLKELAKEIESLKHKGHIDDVAYM